MHIFHFQYLAAKSSFRRNELHSIRDPDTDQNVMHYALSYQRYDVAKVIIQEGDEELLLSHHNVQYSGLVGQRNAIHILIENNAVDEIVTMVLRQIPLTDKKLKLLRMETTLMIQGQRPRLLSCLHLAAYFGRTSLVSRFIEVGMNVNHLNGKHDTALLWASRWGHTETVKLLIAKGAHVDIDNDKGSTALYWAVRYEHKETVRVLLQKGQADPNKTRKLGLVAPLIVASAYGNSDIASLLLEQPRINVNIRIRGGEMPIHHAASEGYIDIVKMLIAKGAVFDEQDELGDTPLLLAAKNGHIDIVNELIDAGARTDHRNNEGLDIWHHAVQNKSYLLLESLTNTLPVAIESDRQPLCIAASSGGIETIEKLIQIGQDPLSTDLDGNTFLHHAAMTDQFKVIETFHKLVSINLQNKQGNTPLHIACLKGFRNTINSLLEAKARSDLKNKNLETCLHSAAHSKSISSESVSKLVAYTIKNHAWETLNEKDFKGNNCLHIAAKHATPGVIWEYRFVRIKDQDKDGLTPLHEAVRPGEPEALHAVLDIFERMKRDARINEQTFESRETVLHFAAAECHSTCVKRLIDLGADVSDKDCNGDTVLHKTVRACVHDSHNKLRHLSVFDTILDVIVTWWCIKQHITIPDENNSEQATCFRREAILYVTQSILNNNGLSVVDQAFEVASPEILSRLLIMPDVTVFEVTGVHQLDISGLIPRTNQQSDRAASYLKRRLSVTPMLDKANIEMKEIEPNNPPDHIKNLSGIEWLITNKDTSRTAEILDLPSLSILENHLTSMVAWLFAILMVVHITYMAVFTYVGVELQKKLREGGYDLTLKDPEIALLFFFVPLEPLAIIIYFVYTFVRFFVKSDLSRRTQLSRKRGFALVRSIITAYIVRFIYLAYAVLVCAWIVLFTLDYRYQDYFLAAVICVGWLLSIGFTRGIRLVHYFYKLLLNMIVRDVSRFVVVYLFVLMAFGFAFHVLFQVSTLIVNTYETPGDTLFLTFNLMIGMGDLFDGTIADGMGAVGRSDVYIKILYLIYMVLGTVILLNLLIAMMNDSYSMILSQNKTAWRIDSVRLGLEIENSFPASKMFSKVKLHRGCLGKTVLSFIHLFYISLLFCVISRHFISLVSLQNVLHFRTELN